MIFRYVIRYLYLSKDCVFKGHVCLNVTPPPFPHEKKKNILNCCGLSWVYGIATPFIGNKLRNRWNLSMELENVQKIRDANACFEAK